MTPIESAVKTLYWFFLYGFIGWGVEVVYAAVKTHKLVNRGFLCGPICPIYGFGMVELIYSVSLIPMPDSGSMSAVAIFFIGMILTTAIELVGGWALFKIYHIRWWDYSNMKFNLGGYICPQFSLLWGLGSVAIGFDCPLTELERWARSRAGLPPLPSQGFIAHYITGVLYPAGWESTVEAAVSVVVLASWVLFAITRRRRSPTRPPSR